MIIEDDNIATQSDGTTHDARMDSTMNAILKADKLLIRKKRDNLLKEISIIENKIKSAGQTGLASHIQTSPELANQLQKDMIFMKRDLAKKKIEYAELK